MANRIMTERTAIAQSFTALSNARPRTGYDILVITERLHIYSIALNVLGGRPAFENSADPQVLVQILEVIQLSVSSFPFSIQSEVNHSLFIIHGLIAARVSVDANVINLNIVLLPLYCKASQEESASAFAAMSMAPTLTHSSPALSVFGETAFYARPESRLP
jgi:hypothetical protein